MAKPHFLCIGARKSGTTWVYKFLENHPKVAMPIIKELNFFSSECFHSDDAARKTYVQEKYRAYRSRMGPKKKHRMSLIPDVPSSGDLPALFGWYEGMFERSINEKAQSLNTQEPLISGDVSPLYQNLPQKRIRLIKEKYPNLKILYILRNPIKRVWSDFNMENENTFGHDLDHPQLDHLLDSIYNRSIRGGLVHRVYSDWKSIFGSNVQLFFFEELVGDPELLGRRICDFIGIEYIENSASSVSNPNPRKKKLKLPNEIAKEIAAVLYHEIDALNQDFNNQYTQSWLDYADQLLEKT